MYGLLHGSMDWIMAGAVVCLGLIVFLSKIPRGEFISLIIGACIWIFVYKIHGGISTTSIMTATFAALLFDLVGLPILKMFCGGKK